MAAEQETPEVSVNQEVGTVEEGGTVIGVQYQGLSIEEVEALFEKWKKGEEKPVWDGRFPYRGLEAFQEKDAEFFFGRDSLINDLLSRAERTYFIAVSGPSGSGKSSLVRAGLLHAFRTNQVPDSENWLIATMKPESNPLENLAEAVEHATNSFEYGDKLREKLDYFPRIIKMALKRNQSDRFVLLVDQFEELFTQTKDPAIRTAFIELLTTAVSDADLKLLVIITLRSDFISHCIDFENLRQLMTEQLVLVGAMQAAELAQAISSPAIAVGAHITADLVSQVIRDMNGEPGALPLMSFVLRELFNKEKGLKGEEMDMTLPEYEALGGIQGSLERHAQKLFANLTTEQIKLAPAIFTKLVEVSTTLGQADTRRTATLAELVPKNSSTSPIKAIIDQLAGERARLLTVTAKSSETDDSAEIMVSLAHEKLISAWPWLQRLIDSNREHIAVQNQINRAAAYWKENGKNSEDLYTGTRLDRALESFEKRLMPFSLLESAFLESSQEKRVQDKQKEQEQQDRIQAQLLLTTPTIIMSDKQNLTQQRCTLALLMIVQALRINSRQKQPILNQGMAYKQLQQAITQIDQYWFSTVLGENTKPCQSVAFAPDGRTLASANFGNIIYLWDVNQTNAPLRTLIGHSDEVYSVAFSPDGNMLASASLDATVRLWDLANPNAGPTILECHEHKVYSVAFSPDGIYLASASRDKTIRLWNPANLSDPLLMILEGHTDSVECVAFSPNWKTLASASRDNTIRLWDMTHLPDSIVLEGHTDWVYSVAYSPDGTALASASTDGTVRLWDLNNPDKPSIVLKGHTHWVKSVAFTPNGRTVISVGLDTTICLWDVHNPIAPPIVLTDHTGTIQAVAIAPDGETFASGGSRTIRVWKPAKITAPATFIVDHTSSVQSVAFTPDGSMLASSSYDNTIRLWDMVNLVSPPIILVRELQRTQPIVFAPDGKTIASPHKDNTIGLWNLEDPQGSPNTLAGHTDDVYAVAFSPDGRTLASASADHTIRLWDLIEPNPPTVLEGHTFWVKSVAFSPDGQTLASAGADDTIRIWDLAHPSALPTILEGHTSHVLSVAFSPNGQTLASASEDYTIRLWNMLDLETSATILEGHTDLVESIAFSPDGQTLASASRDKTIRLWEVASPSSLPAIFEGHLSGVMSVAFSPDGRLLASASQDQTVGLWFTLEQLRDIAIEWVGRNLTWEEWQEYLPGRPYELTCPQYDVHPTVPEEERPE